MLAQLQNNSDTTARRRQPLWPWLLMPLATLVIYFALHNARQHPARMSPYTTPPSDGVAAALPGAESN